MDRVFIMRPPRLGKPEDLKPFVETLAEISLILLLKRLLSKFESFNRKGRVLSKSGKGKDSGKLAVTFQDSMLLWQRVLY